MPAYRPLASNRSNCSNTANTAAYNGVYSNARYNLTGKMVQLELAQSVSQAGWCEDYLELELDANNYFMMQVGVGNILFARE